MSILPLKLHLHTLPHLERWRRRLWIYHCRKRPARPHSPFLSTLPLPSSGSHCDHRHVARLGHRKLLIKDSTECTCPVSQSYRRTIQALLHDANRRPDTSTTDRMAIDRCLQPPHCPTTSLQLARLLLQSPRQQPGVQAPTEEPARDGAASLRCQFSHNDACPGLWPG